MDASSVQRTKVLIVEDAPPDAELVARELEAGLGPCEVRVVDTREEYLAALEAFSPELIVSDYALPVFDGLSALALAIKWDRDVPFLLVTGALNEDTAVACMKAGAWDYILKDRLKRLGPAALGAMAKHRMRVDQRNADAALRRTQASLLEAQRIAHIGSWELDLASGELRLSAEMFRILALDPSAGVPSLPVLFAMVDATDRPLVERAVDDARSGKPPDDLDFRVRRADGALRWVHARSVVACDPRGRSTSATGAIMDITERKVVEESVRETAAKLAHINRELETFASVASHDLQEPLRKIRAFGDLLLREHADRLDPEAKDYLGRMRASAARMQRLIEDLLAYSRVTIAETPFESVDLSRIAREVMGDLEEALARTKGKIDLGELPTIEADPTQMQQLLQNLLANALKFHKPDTPPTVRVRGRLVPSKNGDAPLCEIRVEDDGVGFEPHYAERIFELFQRLRGRSEYEGTGIGLTICRRIAERHLGTITAYGALGEGATFVVTLPSVHRDSTKGSSNV